MADASLLRPLPASHPHTCIVKGIVCTLYGISSVKSLVFYDFSFHDFDDNRHFMRIYRWFSRFRVQKKPFP
ncbi:hypothetical protein B8V81_3624 [Paenibacillus pasadenensis]|uniref:Uncharacterized protein n=1 Tax=Paenibacillus pasadenensis TaxID=217090 RepID=A0A2N5N4D9_9BACL|nr:hypothetical protein B8V81_3624 [Paenibacillus pasadenensis]